MKHKILILSIFPAPYRNGVFEFISREYETSVFYERQYDDNRDSSWFEKNERFIVLNDVNSRNIYKEKTKRIRDFELVLVFDYSTVLSMKLMIKCIINRVPYILNCDGAHITPNLVKDSIKRFFIKRAAACLASGITAKNYFMNYDAKEKNIYYHNFSTLYDKDILSAILTKEEKAKIKKSLNISDEKVALAVGRFIALKNYDILIKAWKSINPDYRLIIIGGGDERENYEKLINENNLSNVELIDYKAKEELQDYYKAADLFVHPTSTDVWGLVINEAMACGLPVITTDMCVAGIELIKDNENGFIVPVGNIDKLAQKISLVLGDDRLREKMATNNLEVIRPYTIENMAKSQISTFEKVLG